MNDKTNKQDSFTGSVEGLIKLLFKCVLPIVLLVSGLVVLALRIAGWSIIFGLPMVMIGSVFLIFTYDEIIQKSVDPFPQDLIECRICGNFIPKPDKAGSKRPVCLVCKQSIRKIK